MHPVHVHAHPLTCMACVWHVYGMCMACVWHAQVLALEAELETSAKQLLAAGAAGGAAEGAGGPDGGVEAAGAVEHSTTLAHLFAKLASCSPYRGMSRLPREDEQHPFDGGAPSQLASPAPDGARALSYGVQTPVAGRALATPGGEAPSSAA